MASYLSLAFLASILIADTYTFVVIKYFKETEGRIKKAIIAALTPAIIFPFTAITKYIVFRKSSEIITPDRAFVLCYFLRGASIVLHRLYCIRRFKTDLEIQNILFEYTTIILSQAFLASYFVMSFDVSPWPVIRASLIRLAISLAIDFVFNIVSVFFQIHFYDISIRKVWLKYWRRHVTANTFIILCMVLYFGTPLVSVFAGNRYKFSKEYILRNCTTLF